MRSLRALVDRVAPSTISVLVLGETGAGKEVLAHAIHRASKRAAGPFLKLHCAALSETLLESELFGHEKGAFTGAAAAKLGLLETAHGGTVFLDELGELPMSIQVKLLRVIEERAVLPVGALRTRAIDVRFVAATNRDLAAEVARGAFRQDLYFRLNGLTLRVPPLRERVDEIGPLAAAFVAEAWRKLDRDDPAPVLTDAALAHLRRHPWPGNVRELKSAIERAALLCSDGAIAPEDLVLEAPATSDRGVAGATMRDELSALEERRIVEALERCGGNQTHAARMLGISRTTLVKRLEVYRVRRPRKATLT
jgi:two-component system, NtrC family, response regulator AtoC